MPFDTNDYSVSVVIPAYNAEQSIRQTIESVLRQTLLPDEIILVDDGSADCTAEIAKSYPQISYSYQENAGVSAACNTGIENAKCRWIAFIDSDDIWLPQKLELQISLLRRNPHLRWVMCNYYFNDCQHNQKFIQFAPAQAARLMGQEDSLDFFGGVLSGIGWARCCMLVERDVLKEAGLFCPGYSAGEDIDLCIRISLIDSEIGFVASPQAEYYFRREGSISSRSYVELVKSRCQNLKKLLELSEKYGRKQDFKPVARKLLIHWTRGLLADGKEGKRLVRDILHRFGGLLSVNDKIELWLKTSLPRTTRLVFKVYFKLKKIIGFPEKE